MIQILFVTKGSFGTKDATGDMLNNVFDGMSNTKVLQYSLCPLRNEDISPIPLVTLMPCVNYSLFSKLCFRFDKRINNKFVDRIWRFVRAILFFFDGIFPPVLTKQELSYIEHFKPDVIYTLGADIKVLKVTRLLSKRFNRPLVIHNMDDYYNIDYKSPHIMRRIYNNLLRKQYHLCYQLSHKSLAIGPQMAKEYTDTFNIPFEWVMNCVKDENIRELDVLHEKVSLIIFSGGLHGGRANTLAAIASYLETAGSIRLEIYTSKADVAKYQTLFQDYKNCTLLNYVEKERMFDNLSRADILLHVESFEPNNIKYFRLSMSTKTPEYMAIGRPILCVGPANIATVNFLKTNRIGHVINDVTEIGSALSELENKVYRMKLINQAHDFVKSEFKQSVMQKKLKDVFMYNVTNKKKNN